jgi:hypothetical protein
MKWSNFATKSDMILPVLPFPRPQFFKSKIASEPFNFII